MFGCNLGTGDYGHITTEHASMLFRNHLSLREYSNQGFEAQHTHYRVTCSYIQRLLPMTGMAMLHQVSFIFYFLLLYFFYIIIHLNTTVLETNIVTYLNIVRTKLTTLFIERLASSSCHFHIVLWYHRWCIEFIKIWKALEF